MSQHNIQIEDTLLECISYILKRTLVLNADDQLAIFQEYKEWLNCISTRDFSEHEILVIDEYTFK